MLKSANLARDSRHGAPRAVPDDNVYVSDASKDSDHRSLFVRPRSLVSLQANFIIFNGYYISILQF